VALLEDVRELYQERLRTRGRLYASVRACWDIAALSVRPRYSAVLAPDRGGPLTARLLDDLRNALRSVTRRRAAGAAVVATLALGLGLAMLTFTLVNGLMLTPLPYPHSQQLVRVLTEFRPESGYSFARYAASGPELADLARQSSLLEIGAYSNALVSVSDGQDAAERVPATLMTAGAFRVLGVAPARGAIFSEAHEQEGAPCTAVLSEGLWRERFGARETIISSSIRVDGRACQVAAIMPAGFGFPNERVRIWLPLTVDAAPDARGNHGYFGIGRVKAGHTIDQARAETRSIMARWERELAHHKGHGFVLHPLQLDMISGVRQSLLVLAWASVLVLVVVCANVSNLLLAHGEARRREFALRSALGARRGSLVRQVIAEGTLLAAIGGAGGALLAWLGVDALVASYPGALPLASNIKVDARVIACGFGLAILAGAVISLVPALRMSRALSSEVLRAGDRTGMLSLGLSAQRWLVVTELALSAAITVGALLLAQSFLRLQQIPLGFQTSGLSVIEVGVPDAALMPSPAVPDFYQTLLERVRRAPGVKAAGAISSVPLLQSPPMDLFTIEGRRVPPPSEPGAIAGYILATPGALESLEVTLSSGRFLRDSDGPGSPAVAVVNQTLAREHWGDASPVGQRIRYPEDVTDGQWSAWGPWITIVGVIDDIRSITPGEPPRPSIYVPLAQRPRSFYEGRAMGLLVRDSGNSREYPQVIRAAARELEPASSVSAARTMDDLLGAAVARPRFLGSVMSVFALISLLIAAVGMYAVVAYGVERRTREIGVRMALGASAASVAGMIGRQTLVMLAAGLAIGLGGAVLLARWMSALLFGVSPMHVPTYAIVASLLSAAVVAAAIVPARRAARVDPLIALRAD
jgi:predicted permease